MGKYEENRTNKRYTIKCKAECCNQELYIININRAGMRIKSSFNIDSKDDISYHLCLPDLEFVTIIGNIIWEKKPEYNNYFYGIKVKSITGSKNKSFEYYLKEIEKFK